MSSEQSRVHDIMRNMSRGGSAGRGLVWDPYTKKIQTVSHNSVPSGTLAVTREDMKHFAGKE